jgi:hypothetical protein
MRVADRCREQTPEGEEALGAISTARSVRTELPASERVAPARKEPRFRKGTDDSEEAIASEGLNGGARIEGTSVSERRAPAGASKEPSGAPRGVSWVPNRRDLRTSKGTDTLPISKEVFGHPRSPTESSDFEGTDAVFGAQRDGQPDRNRRDLRIALVTRGSSRAKAASVVVGRDGEHAGSGAVFGPRRGWRGGPSRPDLRVRAARNAHLVQTELRFRERWIAASGFPARLRP